MGLRRNVRFLVLCATLQCFTWLTPFMAVPLAQAEGDHRSMIATDLKALYATSGLGMLFGWKYASFESKNFSVGGVGYTGQISKSGSANGSFSYGGLQAAFTGRLFGKTDLEVAVLAGGGGGFAGSNETGGIVLEPSLAFGFNLGESVRTTLHVGYIWMPSSVTEFSGVSFGLRFDFFMGSVVSAPVSAPSGAPPPKG